ncbi:MAG: hypothetical protein QM754_14295 [Tepidisphaeraceae bacterium]
MSSVPQVLQNRPKIGTNARQQVDAYEPVCAVFRRYLHGKS